MAMTMATLPSSCHSRGSTSSTLTQGHKCQEQSNHTQCVCTARVCVCVRLATMAARGVGAKDPQAKNKNDQSPIGQHFIFGSARKYATSTLPHPHSHTPTYIHYLQCFQHTHTHTRWPASCRVRCGFGPGSGCGWQCHKTYIDHCGAHNQMCVHFECNLHPPIHTHTPRASATHTVPLNKNFHIRHSWVHNLHAITEEYISNNI